MSAVAIIPARGGSKRIPKKNFRAFHGKPILAYSIKAAQASGLFDEIYVSTDDEKGIDIAREYGCFVHIRSTRELCGDAAGTQEVTRDCVLNSTSGGHDFTCCIYATAPMMDSSDLEFGLAVLKSVGLYRYVYVPGWFYWGRTDAFIQAPNVELATSLCLTPDPARWIDINDEADWELAEKMFTARREMA